MRTRDDEHFVPVTDQAALEPLFARSQEAPVVLFKHDFACPISAAAYREMTRVAGDVPMVDVERDKGVASEVARRTGIRHESPQVIVLRGGQGVWSASHFDITASAVEQAVRENA